MRANGILRVALFVGVAALAIHCELIAGIQTISFMGEAAPVDAGGQQDSEASDAIEDFASDTMATMPPAMSSASEDAGSFFEGGGDSLVDAPVVSGDTESSDSEASSEAPTDTGTPDAGEGVLCESGEALSRTAWPTNPGTSASDNACGTNGIINMFDGALTTRWSTGRVQETSPPEWLEIDLGCLQTFSQIVLDATDDPNDYPRGFTVSVSSDNSTWMQVASGAATTALTTIELASTTARYIQVKQTGIAPSNFWSVDELNVCGVTSGACQNAPTAYPRNGWATNPGTSASDNLASLGNMFDGALSTRWTTNRPQVTSPVEWVEVDMGVSQPFSEVMLQNFDDCNDYPRDYTLQTSNDNNNWTQLVSGAGSTPITTIVFPSTNARYIRIAQTGTAAATFWSIDEFYVLH